jgi:hypothetical protein
MHETRERADGVVVARGDAEDAEEYGKGAKRKGRNGATGKRLENGGSAAGHLLVTIGTAAPMLAQGGV